MILKEQSQRNMNFRTFSYYYESYMLFPALTLFIMDTAKHVFWQTVKTQVISSGSAGTAIHYSIEILTGKPLKYKMDKSMLIVSICMLQSTRMKQILKHLPASSRSSVRNISGKLLDLRLISVALFAFLFHVTATSARSRRVLCGV